jgi:hypothetical protein
MKQTVTTVGLMIENQIIENILIGGRKSRKLALPQFTLYFKTLTFETFFYPGPAMISRQLTRGDEILKVCVCESVCVLCVFLFVCVVCERDRVCMRAHTHTLGGRARHDKGPRLPCRTLGGFGCARNTRVPTGVCRKQI